MLLCCLDNAIQFMYNMEQINTKGFKMLGKSKARKIRELEQKLSKAGTNHILHLILSLLTVGLWVPVWILIAINSTTSIRHLNNQLDKAYDV